MNNEFFCTQIQNYCQAKRLRFETNANLKSLTKCTGSKCYITQPPWLSKDFIKIPFLSYPCVCVYIHTNSMSLDHDYKGTQTC